MGNKNVKQTVPKSTKPLPIDPNFAYYERDAKLSFSRMKWKGDNTTVPLTAVDVNAKILDICSEISITHTYKNTRSEPLEAIFEFTLSSEDAAVCGLSIQIDDKKIFGKVKEKQKAFDTYDDAIASGHNAFLIEYKGKGIYSLSVGSLSPNQQVKVTIDVISELLNYENSSNLLFLLPNTMFPLHTYPLSIDVTIHMSTPVKNVKCNVPNAVINDLNVSVKSPEFNSFYLIIQLENQVEPSSLIEIHESQKSMAFMFTFFPTWETMDKDLVIPSSELIFVVDRSGSMAGSRITAAKSTLQLFLRSLPEGVIFNIVGFGDSQKWLFDSSQPYTESNLQEASEHVDSMTANLGGTELLEPLNKIYKQPFFDEYPRQLFVITDGEVDNTPQVIDATRRESRSTRVFTLGIGEGASQDLVKGLAKVAKGQYEFIKSTTEESMEAKVISQLEKALEPCLRQVKVNWGSLQVKQGPFHIRPVFNGERLVVYGIAENIPQVEEIEIQLEGTGPDGNQLVFPMKINMKNAVKGTTVHKLAAKQILRDLEDNKSYVTDKYEIQSEIVRLAVKYQLASSETSFVAVSEKDEATEQNMVQAIVPSAPTQRIVLPQSGGGMKSSPSPAKLDSAKNRHSSATKTRSGSTKLDSVLNQVESVKQTMNQNISMSLSRADKLDSLEEKSHALSDASISFKKSAPRKKESKKLDDSLSMAMRRTEVASIEEEDNDSWEDELEGGLLSPPTMSAPPPPVSALIMNAPPAPASEPARAPVEEKRKEKERDVQKDNDVHKPKPFQVPPRNGPLKMNDVIKAQRANGSWDLRHVEWMTTIALDKLKSSLTAKSSDLELLETCWATCLVVAMLEEQYAANKNEWNLVEQKARKFVKRSLVTMNVNEDLFEDAKKYVKSNKLKIQ